MHYITSVTMHTQHICSYLNQCWWEAHYLNQIHYHLLGRPRFPFGILMFHDRIMLRPMSRNYNFNSLRFFGGVKHTKQLILLQILPYYPAYKARDLYKSLFSVFRKFWMDEPALYKAYIWAVYMGWVPLPI